MVDFQSRDTNRGFGNDEDEDEDEDEEEETAEASTGPQQEATRATGQTEPDATPAEAADPPGADADHGSGEPATRPGEDHEAAGGREAEQQSMAYAVVTITDDRSLSDDDQGDTAVGAIEAGRDRVRARDLVRSGYDNVQSTVSALAERRDVDAVVTIGGTGVEPDDVTTEALDPLFEKHLPGFGELFRLLAHETEGTAVVGTRATAGLIDQTPVFVLPGTTAGVRLAMDEIVVQEAPRLAADAATDDA